MVVDADPVEAGILATRDERRDVEQGLPTGTRRATRSRVTERTRSSDHAAFHRTCRPALLLSERPLRVA
jgi:hypothetical protein